MAPDGIQAPPGETVLLTGALGGVGEHLIGELLALGYAVACLDLPNDANRGKARRLARRHRFDMHWGDLTRADAVTAVVDAVRPAAVVHAAAIIPPLSFRRPDLARAVNVGGTANLVAACMETGSVRRFVMVSSYSVHGPVNPAKAPPRWTGDTPVDPQDDYARQKVEAERIVRASGLEQVVVRLCAVFPVQGGSLDPDMMRFSFALPYDRREQAIDVRDAALAIARASVVAAAAGRTLDVGGGAGWDGIGGEMLNAMTGSMGLRPLPREAYRLPDPAVDASWYYENWVDTAPSQALLGYQRYSFDDFLAERRRRAGIARYLLPLIAGRIQRKLLRLSPWHGKPPAPDARPFAEAAAALFADGAPARPGD